MLLVHCALAAVPIKDVAQVAAGPYHSCVLTAAGGVQCWGDNVIGQLGDGTEIRSLLPVGVVGLTGVTSLAVGGSHTCAVNSGGAVWCWGANESGQLGNGTTVHSNVPQMVPALSSGVAAVSAGWAHTCALMLSGGVKCWGPANANGTATIQLTPVDVSGLSSGVLNVSAGGFHNCALLAGGGIKCWGNNAVGQAGNGTTTTSPFPTDVIGLASGVSNIGSGLYGTCAVTAGSVVMCWGNSIANGSSVVTTTPMAIAGLAPGVTSVVQGSGHSCAMSSGAVQCWGDNEFGQLANGLHTPIPSLTPVSAQNLGPGAVALTANQQSTCALMSDSTVKCWGRNDIGQIGNNTAESPNVPVDIPGLASNIQSVSSGGSHNCVVTSGGGVKCWGTNDSGQIGNGTLNLAIAPVDVTGLGAGVSAVVAASTFSCALVSGAVRCWGANNSGQLGDGTTTRRLIPTPVVGLGAPVTAISATTSHTCALTDAGGVKCWGSNADGEIGNGGAPGIVTAPVDVVGLTSGVAAIAAGYGHTCALKTNGTAKCWGQGAGGALGTGTVASSNIPVDVLGLSSGIAPIHAREHTCVLTLGGAIKCWGLNFAGALGDGTTSNALSPVDVIGIPSGAIAVATGYDPAFPPSQFSCALTGQGRVECWGSGNYGQHGNRTKADTSSAGGVPAFASGVAGLSAGSSRACVVTVAGGVKCWGLGTISRLGITPWQAIPTLVLVGPTPDPFAFPSVGGVAVGSTQTSSTITLTGLASPASIGVTGGGYSVGCTGTFTTSSGAIANGETVCVRHTASPSNLTPVTTTLTIGGVDGTFTSTTVAGTDTTPDPFSFPSVTGVPLGSVQTSAPASITGINAATPISVAGGSYSIGCTAVYTSAAGTITNGQTVCLRHTTFAIYSFSVTTTLTIGGVSGTFTSTTLDDTVPNPFSFGSVTGVPRLSIQTSAVATIDGISAPTPVTVAGGSYSVGCTGTFTTAAGNIDNFQTVCLRHTASAAYSTSVTTTLTIGGVNGTFTSTTLDDTVPNPFSFTNVTGVPRSSTQTSNAVTIDGITAATPVSVSGGTYSIGCTGSFTASAGSINNFQTVCVRHTASPLYSLSVTTTLTIGGISGTFTSTTLDDTVPNPFSFPSLTGVPPASVQASATVTIDGLTGATPISVSGGSYSIGCTGTFTTAVGSIGNFQTVCVRHTAATGYSQDTVTTLTIGGVGGTFTTTTAAACGNFSDVGAGDFFCPNVEWLRNRSVTLGCGPGIYCPGDIVTRGAMAAFQKSGSAPPCRSRRPSRKRRSARSTPISRRVCARRRRSRPLVSRERPMSRGSSADFPPARSFTPPVSSPASTAG